jgi:predicted DNA-binding transcriptional regulator AlpA
VSDVRANEDVVRRVIGSLGFPPERVDRAVSCLLAKSPALTSPLPVDRVLSFRETCQMLSLSKSGLRRIMNTGTLKPIRLSERRIGFRADDINTFVRSRNL